MSIIKKIFLVLSLLAFTSCVAVGPRCTYTQAGTKISSWIWFTKSMPQINQQTGLTRTQSALLSPSEQVIARRT